VHAGDHDLIKRALLAPDASRRRQGHRAQAL